MNNNNQNLASRLTFLPLDLPEKVLMWLTYKDLKPVSEINIVRRKQKPTEENIKKVKKWLNDAGLFFTPDKHKDNLHIGHDKEQVVLSAKIIHKLSFKNEFQTGILFGYPENSAKEYAESRNLIFGENPTTIISPGYFFIHPKLKNESFTPYLFYAISSKYFEQDIQTAKLWADTIRKDTPLLAKWFENHIEKIKQKEKVFEKTWSKRMTLSTLPIKDLFNRYSSEKISPKQTFISILKDFQNSLLDEFQVGSMSFILLNKISKNHTTDQDLVTALKNGTNLHKLGKSLNIKKIIQNTKNLTSWYNANK